MGINTETHTIQNDINRPIQMKESEPGDVEGNLLAWQN